jgi:hypothetical protein
VAETSEPCASQRVFVASRLAVLSLWGEAGLADVASRLPVDARSSLIDSAIISEAWLPERFVMAWQEAVWNGPCQGDGTALRHYTDRVVDSGFGRVRRLLVSMVTPVTLCTRAAELWHDEHTHGQISAEPKGNVVVIRLRDHPYVARPISCLVMAESLRHAASLTRVRHVAQMHHMVDGALEVRLTWS